MGEEVKTRNESIHVRGIDDVVWTTLNGRAIRDCGTTYLTHFLTQVSARACNYDIKICNMMADYANKGLIWTKDTAKELYKKQDDDWSVCACVIDELKRRGYHSAVYESIIRRYS